MPIAIYVLGLAIFAQGTSELMLTGLLPELSQDLGVSISDAGLLISAFAIGMLVGAPVLAVVTLRWPRRTALLTFLAVFAFTHVVGALAPNYEVLLATRAVGAFVYAGFWAVAAVTALSLVPDDRRGRAMSIVAGGLTVATIVGLPAGTAVGQHLGWRAAFWGVALMSTVAMAGVLATVPRTTPDRSPAKRITSELRAMSNPRLWLAYSTTALSTGALLVTFSYFAPLLTDVTGLSEGWIPAVLALYGAGALIGITIGGRTSDERPFATLLVGFSGLVALSVGIALWADQPIVAIVLISLLGAFGFATNPAVNTRVFSLAEGAPTLAAAVNVSAFNVGITIAPWLGGLAIEAGTGYAALGWIGAAIGTLALLTVILAATRPAPAPAAPQKEACATSS
jgi:DHA1 family chloramphenicol resistance protein-like MFS transporter